MQTNRNKNNNRKQKPNNQHVVVDSKDDWPSHTIPLTHNTNKKGAKWQKSVDSTGNETEMKMVNATTTTSSSQWEQPVGKPISVDGGRYIYRGIKVGVYDPAFVSDEETRLKFIQEDMGHIDEIREEQTKQNF